ncbi:Spo0E family sporulation regulatory protein-aspartic acid phosphatase [Lysinibacillus sp. NPDC096418]|uniref:Spo0E family sporulation regulatory protein-aspartic acid phosphatase n=1 Tax=Lysinibacillus sp. NPDC096418 TaxID=3364138 RepID=UPI0037F39C77
MLNIKILKLAIEYKRKVMYKKAKDLGFTHPKVVMCSQELDALLNMYWKQVS